MTYVNETPMSHAEYVAWQAKHRNFAQEHAHKLDVLRASQTPQALWKALNEWKFTEVRQYLRHEGRKVGKEPSGAYLYRGICALKQYYYDVLTNPTGEHPVSYELYPFWYAHLQSADYSEFCTRFAGKGLH